MKAKLIAAAILSPLVALPAIANPTAFKTADGSVGVVGLSPYQSLRVENLAVNRSRSISGNACGVARIADSESFPLGTTIKIGSTTHTVADIPSGPSPVCRDGQLTTGFVASVMKNSEGDLFVQVPAYGSVTAEYPNLASSRSSKASACGMVLLRNSATFPIGTQAITLKTDGETPTTVLAIANPSTLSEKIAPLCSKGVAFYPENW